MVRFELTTSTSRTWHANRTALHPDKTERFERKGSDLKADKYDKNLFGVISFKKLKFPTFRYFNRPI